LVQRGDRARSSRGAGLVAGVTDGVTDGGDGVADDDGVRLGLHGGQARGVAELQHGDVVGRVGADDCTLPAGALVRMSRTAQPSSGVSTVSTSSAWTQGRGQAMTEWQGPFVGMQELLAGCGYVGVIAGMVSAAVAWRLHRRSVRERQGH
jgi:hypothetical protein